MEALTQIMTHKFKFMSHYQNQNHLQFTNNQLMDILLKQKKKQSINQVVQNRLIQNLLTKRIQTPYQVQQFITKSLYLMKLSTPQFIYQQQHQDSYTHVVQIYIAFFNHHACQLRKQEISHIYYKKLCDKSLLLPTIFNWFNQWTRKKFVNFLKVQLAKQAAIKRLQHNSAIGLKSTFNQKRTIRSELQEGKAIIIKDSQAPKISQLLQTLPKQNNNQKYIANSLHSLVLQNKKQRKISLKSQGNEEQQQKKFKTDKIKKEAQWPIDQNFLVNRDTFFGAYNQQVQNFYSQFISSISDLDINYVKGVRKNDKRQQYNGKINFIAGVFAKNQIQIKKSIDNYDQSYKMKFSKKYKNKSIPKQNKKDICNSISPVKQIKRKKIVFWQEQFNSVQYIKQREEKNDYIIESKLARQFNPSILRNKSSSNFQNSKRQTIQYSLKDYTSFNSKNKTIQLKLPELPQSIFKESIETKNLLQKRIKKRYPNSIHINSHLKHLKNVSQQISVQIRKQIKNMNKIYNKQDNKQKKINSPLLNQFQQQDLSSIQKQDHNYYKQLGFDRQILLKQFRALGRKSIDLKRKSKLEQDQTKNNFKDIQFLTSKNKKSYQEVFYFPKLNK